MLLDFYCLHPPIILLINEELRRLLLLTAAVQLPGQDSITYHFCNDPALQTAGFPAQTQELVGLYTSDIAKSMAALYRIIKQSAYCAQSSLKTATWMACSC